MRLGGRGPSSRGCCSCCPSCPSQNRPRKRGRAQAPPLPPWCRKPREPMGEEVMGPRPLEPLCGAGVGIPSQGSLPQAEAQAPPLPPWSWETT